MIILFFDCVSSMIAYSLCIDAIQKKVMKTLPLFQQCVFLRIDYKLRENYKSMNYGTYNPYSPYFVSCIKNCVLMSRREETLVKWDKDKKWEELYLFFWYRYT